MQFLNAKDNFTLISTNAYVEDYPFWDSDTTYNTDDRVIYNNHIYKSLVDDNNEEPTTGLNWFDEGATNPYKCIDKFVNTQTKNPNNLEMWFGIKQSNCIALLNIIAIYCKIEIYDNYDNLVYEAQPNVVTGISNWGDYFFGEIDYINKLIITFPNIFFGKMRLYLEANEVAIGVLQIGLLKDLGITLIDVKASIDDYSQKETDDYGNTYLKEGNFTDRVECNVLVDISTFNIVKKRLIDIRATPVVYIASNKDIYRELNLYGIYENFDFRVEDKNQIKCELTLKGLI